MDDVIVMLEELKKQVSLLKQKLRELKGEKKADFA